MPHLNGYQVMAQLKALNDPLLPPIVILTAQYGRDHLLKALTQGARDFVGKPFDRIELLMRVRNLLDAQLAHHHEKWNGSGYPAGLAGDAIPMAGRIVAVADVFDALTSSRPYKKAWPVQDAVAFMREYSGTHFDPEMVAHFLLRFMEILAITEFHADAVQESV